MLILIYITTNIPKVQRLADIFESMPPATLEVRVRGTTTNPFCEDNRHHKGEYQILKEIEVPNISSNVSRKSTNYRPELDEKLRGT
jgi:hypothetical protein